MKHLRITALAAVAAMAFMALGAGSASADLYTDAGKTVKYPTGTTISATLAAGKSASLHSGSQTIGTCTGGEVHGSTANETGTVLDVISSMTWTGCSQTTHTVASGSLSISISGEVTGSGSQVTLVFFGVSCTYGTAEGTKLGTLGSGETPALKMNAKTPKVAGGFLCPSFITWEAEIIVTAPHALYVG